MWEPGASEFIYKILDFPANLHGCIFRDGRGVCDMDNQDNRAKIRKNVAFAAVAMDPEGEIKVPCFVRNASADGCQIYSSQIDDLPQKFLIKVPGIEKPLVAQTIWKDGDRAGVSILWPDTIFV